MLIVIFELVNSHLSHGSLIDRSFEYKYVQFFAVSTTQNLLQASKNPTKHDVQY